MESYRCRQSTNAAPQSRLRTCRRSFMSAHSFPRHRVRPRRSRRGRCPDREASAEVVRDASTVDAVAQLGIERLWRLLLRHEHADASDVLAEDPSVHGAPAGAAPGSRRRAAPRAPRSLRDALVYSVLPALAIAVIALAHDGRTGGLRVPSLRPGSCSPTACVPITAPRSCADRPCCVARPRATPPTRGRALPSNPERPRCVRAGARPDRFRGAPRRHIARRCR
jgi:hypothetical protein